MRPPSSKRSACAAHPEGGWYVETWRAEPAEPGGRPSASAILFLLAAGERSHWHRVDAAEIWQWSGGAPLELRIRRRWGRPRPIGSAADVDERCAPAGSRARPMPGRQRARWVPGPWSGCIVSPAFDFAGFELAPPGWEPTVAAGCRSAARGVAPLDRAREAVAERRAQAAGHVPGPADRRTGRDRRPARSRPGRCSGS